MGLNPGKKNRKLVDMAAVPADFMYVRRDDATHDVDIPIYLSECEVMRQSEWYHRGQIVDFAFNHYLEAEHPDNPADCNVDVSRIDTCHNEVHQHQYFRSGRSDDRIVLVPLQNMTSIEEAEQAIRDCYEDCFDTMIDGWQQHSARWKGEAA